MQIVAVVSVAVAVVVVLVVVVVEMTADRRSTTHIISRHGAIERERQPDGTHTLPYIVISDGLRANGTHNTCTSIVA